MATSSGSIERLFRFHPNTSTMVYDQVSHSSSEHQLEYPSANTTTVRICKHCSHSFYIAFAEIKENIEYCSKDCRVCHTWYKSPSATIKSTISISRSSSPLVKIEKSFACATAIGDFCQKGKNLHGHSNNSKMRDHYSLRRPSDTSNKIESTTWRSVNPQGVKKLLPINSFKEDNKVASISPSSVTAGSSTENSHPPPLQRVMSFFY